MATLIDLGLLQNLTTIFGFIFVWLIVYAILQFTGFLGRNQGINILIGLCVGVFALFSGNVMEVIKQMVPWFVLVFIFLIFLLLIFKIFGTEDAKIREAVKDKSVMYWIITFSILILVIALANVYGGGLMDLTETTTGSTEGFEQSFWTSFFHPKLLGLIFVLLICVFTIKLMAGEVSKQP